MAGLRNRFQGILAQPSAPVLAGGLRGRYVDEEDEDIWGDDEIQTVIKETDDDSPNTKTTTITRGRGPSRDAKEGTNWTSGIEAPKVGNGEMATGDTDKVLGILDGLLSEVGSGPGGQPDAATPQEPPRQTIFDRLGEVNGGVPQPQPQDIHRNE